MIQDWTGQWVEGVFLILTGDHTGQDWIRDQSYAGPYSPKKQVYKQAQEGQLTEVGNWTSGWTAKWLQIDQFADVLLLKAEAEAVTGSDDLGLVRLIVSETELQILLAGLRKQMVLLCCQL